MNKELRIKKLHKGPACRPPACRQAGFTLAEVLAVMLVFTIVGSVAGAILITSLRTSNKSAVITAVNQNGNYAISQMTKLIRDARYLQSPYPCNVATSPTVAKSVVLTSTQGDTITLSCNGTSDVPMSTIASNGASLLDTTAVSLQSCNFTCSQAVPSDFPVIGISFSLSQATGNLPDQTASASPIVFSTSITLRNLNR